MSGDLKKVSGIMGIYGKIRCVDRIFLAAPKFLHVSGKVILFEVGEMAGGHEGGGVLSGR